MEVDPRRRFSGRAEYYDVYRPKYPETLLTYLRETLSLSPRSVVADIGSGTGILTELLLKNGNTVLAIEPNHDMRMTAEARLSGYPTFKSINASAESTTLPNDSVDFIIAAQSFHWFQPEPTNLEFRRILRLNGWVVLIWNTRKTSTPFLQAYDSLVAWIAGHRKNRVKHEDFTDSAVTEFLGRCEAVKLENSQRLDFDGLAGRLMSASYSPLPGQELYQDLIGRARELFDRYEKNGTVEFLYWTEVYAGKLRQT